MTGFDIEKLGTQRILAISEPRHVFVSEDQMCIEVRVTERDLADLLVKLAVHTRRRN